MNEVVFGIPGSGKTTYLLDRIEKLVEMGYAPSDIAYLTMTRTARSVAKKRMVKKFGATKDDLNYFRTIHSICWEMIGRPDKIKQSDIREFCKKKGVNYDDNKKGDGETFDVMHSKTSSLGGLYFTVYDKLRVIHKTDMEHIDENLFTKIWADECSRLITEPSQLWAAKDWFKAYQFLLSYEKYKRKSGIVDFPDMLYLAYLQNHIVPTKILIIDEFQDLTPLMYSIYKQWQDKKEFIVIAGDDDQAIYSFMGACPDFLLEEKNGSFNVTTLENSYRCPQEILDYARLTIERNEKRHFKKLMSDKTGGVISEVFINDGGWVKSINQKNDTLILARTNYMINRLSQDLITSNIPFNFIELSGFWSDNFIHIVNAVVKLTSGKDINSLSIEEFRSLVGALPSKAYLRRGVKKELKTSADVDRPNAFGLGFYKLNTKKEFAAALKLSKTQQEILSKWGSRIVGKVHIRVGTIHKAKGDEAEDVFVQTLLPEKTVKGMKNQNIKAEERRVRYVALTRPKKRLILLRNGKCNDIKDF